MLPDIWKQHTVTFEGVSGTGTGAFGDVLAAPLPLEGFLEQVTKKVQGPNGTEETSTSTFYTDPGPVIKPRAKVTLPDGTETKVIIAHQRDADEPLPSHIEIHLA